VGLDPVVRGYDGETIAQVIDGAGGEGIFILIPVFGVDLDILQVLG